MTERMNNEFRAELRIQSDRSSGYVSLNSRTIAYSSPRQLRDDRLNVLVVEAKDDSSVKRNTIGKNSKTLLNLFDATSKMVEMIGVYVCQHRNGRRQQK